MVVAFLPSCETFMLHILMAMLAFCCIQVGIVHGLLWRELKVAIPTTLWHVM